MTYCDPNSNMPCLPWGTIADVCGKCATEVSLTLEDSSPTANFATILEKQIQIATATVFRLTRGIYTGLCTEKIYPCKKDCNSCGLGRDWAGGWYEPYIYSMGNRIYNGNPCDCFNSCECGEIEEIKLPVYPFCSITEIVVGGATLPEEAYLLRDGLYLRRIDGAKWPTCQDLNPDSPNSWSVEFVHGIAPPVDLVEHTLAFACQLAFRCLDKPCSLPARYTVKNGIGFLDPMDFVKNGLTGYAPLDAVIRFLNPALTRRAPRVVRTSVSGGIKKK